MDIAAIERSVMTADETMLKLMAESMPYEIYSKLSVDARGRLAKAYGKEVPASIPYMGKLPLKKAHRMLTEKERDRMIDLWAHAPLTYIPYVDDELMKLGLVRWYDEERIAVENTEVPFYDKSGRILLEWYDFKKGQ